jgi:hypothetical protein
MSRKLGIMQPYLFPHLAYFQLMNAVDRYVIYDDVQFIKGGWINRNNILIGGDKVLFTITLRDASPNKLINEINISDTFEKFQKTLTMTYSKAPYKEPVLQLIKRICDFEDKNLAQFIGNSFGEIAQYLGMNTEFLYSSNLEKDTRLKGQDKVIEICRELDADVYINAIGGQSLYDKEVFRRNNIELLFLETDRIRYKQIGSDFVEGLSIIDILMFNSKDETRQLLNAYELV